jgi:hypothetical protein
MEREVNIFGYEDGTTAVIVFEDDKNYHLMLKHSPNFLGNIDEKHKDKLLEWLLSKEIKKEKEAEIRL